MEDINTREDIERLVDEFYKKVITDELIGYFFTEVIQLDWEEHIPTMYDFWESMLLGSATYKGNPMIRHIALNEREPLRKQHFDRWLELWESTLDLHFDGPVAEEALKRARSIALLMQYKIEQSELK